MHGIACALHFDSFDPRDQFNFSSSFSLLWFFSSFDGRNSITESKEKDKEERKNEREENSREAKLLLCCHFFNTKIHFDRIKRKLKSWESYCTHVANFSNCVIRFQFWGERVIVNFICSCGREKTQQNFIMKSFKCRTRLISIGAQKLNRLIHWTNRWAFKSQNNKRNETKREIQLPMNDNYFEKQLESNW